MAPDINVTSMIEIQTLVSRGILAGDSYTGGGDFSELPGADGLDGVGDPDSDDVRDVRGQNEDPNGQQDPSDEPDPNSEATGDPDSTDGPDNPDATPESSPTESDDPASGNDPFEDLSSDGPSGGDPSGTPVETETGG